MTAEITLCIAAWNTADQIALGELLVLAVVGGVGALISYFVARISRAQWIAALQNLYTEVHQRFWDDIHCRRVRSWLACRSKYAPLQAVLKKRMDDKQRDYITAEEYKYIEHFDEFLNLLALVVDLNAEYGGKNSPIDGLFLTYWIDRAVGRIHTRGIVHEELKWYVCTFYPTIAKKAEVYDWIPVH